MHHGSPDDDRTFSSPEDAYRQTLYKPPSTKICYFYRDGDVNFKGIKLAINQRRYHDLGKLKNELSDKISLPFGVRSIYTPHGTDHLRNLDSLEHEGKYVCSTHPRKAKGVDMEKVGKMIPWQSKRAPSGRRGYGHVYKPKHHRPVRPVRYAWRKNVQEEEESPVNLLIDKTPMKITVIKNGDASQRRVILLNKRTAQSFEQVLDDIGSLFRMAVRAMYTTEGQPVRSLSGIVNGPGVYVVAGGEKFKAISVTMSEPGPTPQPPPKDVKRKSYTGDIIHSKQREKKEKLSRTCGKWNVWLTTNDLATAGTTAQVTITAYGTKGDSGPITLGQANGQYFQAGNIDEFDISVGNTGEIYKIRIAHDNTGDFPGWFCDEVRMEDIDTHEKLNFVCRRWLSRDEEDCEICREMPAKRLNETVLPIFNYEITVVTGEAWNAKTDANVYITLYGDRGDTGVRQLYKTRRSDKFQMGQTDVFTLEAVSLGNIKRVIVGHDGTGAGYGWFLDKVIVRESSSSDTEWIFPCARWLDEGEDDGKTTRELIPSTEYKQGAIENERWKYEKWYFEAENQIALYSKVTGRPLRIKADGSVDGIADYSDPEGVFIVLGKKENLRTFRSAAHPRFHLLIDKGVVSSQSRVNPYSEFRVHVLEDHSIAFESSKFFMQHVTVLSNGKAGDPRGTMIDPTRQFHVYCKGMFRDQGVVVFCTSLTQTLCIDHDNTLFATGKRKRVAYFRVHKVSEGNIRMFESVICPKQFIRIKNGQCDCMGTGDKNCHFKVERIKEKGYVTLESVITRSIFIGMTPDGKVRPTVNTGDKNVRLRPVVIDFGTPKSTIRQPTPPPFDMKPKHIVRKPNSTPEESSRHRSPSPEIYQTKEKSDVSDVTGGDWGVKIASLETAKNASVTIVVYGNAGSSGPIILGKSGEGLFQKGNQDEFKVNLEKVGKVYKIRLELHSSSPKLQPSWKVAEVKMQDLTTKEVLKFKMNRWLSRTEDDYDIMREHPVVRPGKPVLAVLTYEVIVYTGQEPGSDTDAAVYLTLFGERGDTGKRQLFRSSQRNKFQEGQVDAFEIEAVDLGKLTRAVVCHNGMGAGEGWYCEQILVRESKNATHEYVFSCGRWLDTSMDDGRIERSLKPQEDTRRKATENTKRTAADDTKRKTTENTKRKAPVQQRAKTTRPESPEVRSPVAAKPKDSPVSSAAPTPVPEEPAKEGDWQVWIQTGNSKNMGTTNSVMLYAYGDKACSGPTTLAEDKHGQCFMQGNNDEFKVNLGTKMGELYKVRVGHDDKDPKSGWYIEKAKMKNMISGELFNFKVNRWLSRRHDDLDIWRELPVIRPGEKPLAVVVYVVEVYTGTEPGSDTDATLYIQLFGSRGDSGRRVLYKSKTNDNKFQEGQTDVFQIEAVDLGEVKKVTIGHDGKGKGAGWFCDKVIVKDGDQSDAQIFYFPCGRWLDEGLEDGLIEREILAQEPPKQSKGEYTVFVKTHPNSTPPNGSPPTITCYGEKARSKDIELRGSGELFQPGNTDQFEIKLGDIGDLYKIRISRQDNDIWKGWHLEEVTLQDKDTEEKIVFPFDRWLDRAQDDHDIVRELPVTVQGKQSLPMENYIISVYMGDHWAAETDASMYITIYGKKGDSGKRCLYHSQSNVVKFQKKEIDVFMLEAVTLNELERVVVGHDGKGHGAGCFLEKIVISPRSSGTNYIFPCGRWLDDGEDDGKTERELPLLDTGELNDNPKIKEGTKTQGQWKVKVKTSDLHNAGTHAQVYLTAYGDKGNSGQKELGKASIDSDQFEKGKTSEFNINMGDIGSIYKIRVEHNNTNDFPSWHLEQIVMTDMHTEEELKFFVNRWLSEDEEDGHLCRELAVQKPSNKMKPQPVLRYYVAVYTANMKESGTTANVWIQIFGQFGDSGRRPLDDSRYHNIKWIAGQVDIFRIEAVSLGGLKDVVLEHDGKDQASAWCVEKVIIKESDHALSEFVFHCNQWIETQGRGKPATMRIPCSAEQLVTPLSENELLLARPEKITKGNWTLWTTTEKDQVTPTSGQVTVTMCGTQGSSQPQVLEAEQEGKQLFIPGNVDQFKLSVGEIGDISKVRIQLENKGQSSVMHLKKIKLKDDQTGEEFHFVCDKWIRGKENNEEEELIVELPAVRPDIPALTDMIYYISVTTGSMLRADTEATVYCVLVGELGDTGRRTLTKSTTNPVKFCLGQTDNFEISALNVGPLKEMIIGHNGVGRGNGWFCQNAVVTTSDDPDRDVVFPCHRWLDTGCEDRKLERVLLPVAKVLVTQDEEGQAAESLGHYKVNVTTAAHLPRAQQNPTAGKRGGNLNTNNNNNRSSQGSDLDIPELEGATVVTLTVYGQSGVAGPFELNNQERDMFSPGKKDEFDLSVGDIGEVYKIRLCDASNLKPDRQWKIRQMLLHDVDTKKNLTFDFNKWVGEVGGDIRKELPTARPNQDILPVIQYQVVLHTNGEPSSGKSNSPSANSKQKQHPQDKKTQKTTKGSKTDAQTSGGEDKKSEIFLRIFGTRGDTGFRHLTLNEADLSNFKVNIFHVDAVDIGEVERVELLKGPGLPCYLNKVCIKSGRFAAEEYIFTSDRPIGEDGKVDELTRVELKLTECQPSSIAIPAEDAPHLPKSKGIWNVWTSTGDDHRAGTTSAVVMIMCGEKQDSQPIPLTAPKGVTPFKIGQQDVFKSLTIPICFANTSFLHYRPLATNNNKPEIRLKDDIGDIQKIRLGFEDMSEHSSWFLKEIAFQDRHSQDEFSCEVNDWIESTEAKDGWKESQVLWPGTRFLPLTTYKLEVLTGDRSNAGTNSNVYINIFGKHGSTGKRLLKKATNNSNKFEQGQMDIFELEAVNLLDLQRVLIGHDGKGAGNGWFLENITITEMIGTGKPYVFNCGRWLDVGQDDKSIERELFVTGKQPPRPSGEDWKVWATTSQKENASTDSQVVVVIYGEKGRSEEIALEGNLDEKFNPGQTDEFEVKVRPGNLGKVYKVRVGFSADTESHPSWHLQKMKLKNLKTDEDYNFVFNDWILCPDDRDSWVEIPVTNQKGQKPLPVHKYHVEVYTADRNNAGTDAHVYMTIFGSRGDTGERKLLKSLNNAWNKFEQGQLDIFEISAVDLGDLKKLIIGHDGTSYGAGWYLDKIIIKESETAGTKFVFNCDRWLDQSEDDGLIERELYCSQGEEWRVTVTTGAEKGAECDGPATLVLYGVNGQSNPFQIGATENFQFQQGRTQQVKAMVSPAGGIEDLGDLYKVRVGFERQDEEEAIWQLQKLHLENVASKKQYVFELNDWVKLVDYSDSWKEIPLKQTNKEDILPVIKYEVEVHTGIKSGSGTDANVYLQIFGERGDTGVRKLLKSKVSGKKFESGKVDLFVVEAVDLKDLLKVVVGHDGKGLGSGWYLKKVIIRSDPHAIESYLFDCDRWLDEDEDDGLTEREFGLTDILGENEVKDGDWRVFIQTGEKGTEATVTLTVFGDAGDSGPLVLGEPGCGLFEATNTDQFDIWLEKPDIGKISKIRIEHDNSESNSEWFIERIVMEDLYNFDRLEFQVGRWLADDKDDGDTVRELPAEWPQERPLPVMKYVVETVTGDAFGAGTDANVFITLVGDEGDSGKRFLRKSKKGRDKFEKGETDTFDLEAVGLGELKQVVIGHDQKHSGSGWYLDQVNVKETDNLKKQYVFPCNKWLDKDEGDKLTVRTLDGKKV